MTTPLSPAATALAAAAGSAGLLLAAFGFQHLGGYAPCVMCILQRWPHALAVIIGAWAWIRRGKPDFRYALAAGGLAALAATALAAFHVGIELGMLASPFGCGIPDWSDPNLARVLQQGGVPDCSKPAWTLLGMSMAAWNALISAGLAAAWAAAFAAERRARA